jgi:hypothetical protein
VDEDDGIEVDDHVRRNTTRNMQRARDRARGTAIAFDDIFDDGAFVQGQPPLQAKQPPPPAWQPPPPAWQPPPSTLLELQPMPMTVQPPTLLQPALAQPAMTPQPLEPSPFTPPPPEPLSATRTAGDWRPMTTETGEVYWYNAETAETSWTAPRSAAKPSPAFV